MCCGTLVCACSLLHPTQPPSHTHHMLRQLASFMPGTTSRFRMRPCKVAPGAGEANFAGNTAWWHSSKGAGVALQTALASTAPSGVAQCWAAPLPNLPP